MSYEQQPSTIDVTGHAGLAMRSLARSADAKIAEQAAEIEELKTTIARDDVDAGLIHDANAAEIERLRKENAEQHSKLSKLCVDGGYKVCARCGDLITPPQGDSDE